MHTEREYSYKEAAAGGATFGALVGGIFATMVVTSALVIRVLR